MGRHNNSHGHSGHRNADIISQQNPEWESIGHGVLALKSNPNTHIKLAGGRRGAFVSFSRTDTDKLQAAPVAGVATTVQ